MATYSVKQVYEKIAGTKPRVHWDKVVWNRLNNPKHRFIGWLAMQSRLQTTSKLARIGVSHSALCLICGQGDETHHHLFFQRVYSCEFIRAVKSWLVMVAAVYLIWKCRNTSFWENYVLTVTHTLNKLKQLPCIAGSC
ncbi:uncharacterized mitochondrial protein AtMg00120-like [Spinacia oleracea]|uniref:Uncharacterized mitochondrial protein AtMg00120-like n=1 Tax=Spinacia oleracea TaxID=3562 RepID=A0ABM3QRD8_SPIOL|nr:uncharacterized mitochondrial protein AtMg00120-like [Spinacia oleracea]